MRGGRKLFLSAIISVTGYFLVLRTSITRISNSDPEIVDPEFEFLSGNSLAEFADYRMIQNFADIIPKKMRNNSIIFLKTDYIREFINLLRDKIRTSFVLITHNSAYHMPGPLKNYFIDNPYLIHYLAQNANIYHPKISALPVGIDNAHRNKFRPNTDKYGQLKMPTVLQHLPAFKKRKILLHVGFTIENNIEERSLAMKIMQNKFPVTNNSGDIFYGTAKSNHSAYLWHLRNVKFIVSPPGRGIDCHRTWEALIMGCVPIVKNSTISELYRNQPIVVVNDWNEVTPESLQKYEANLDLKRTSGVVSTKVVTASFWKRKILQKAKGL